MYYIAQANYARWNDEVSSELMEEFSNQSVKIHKLAETSKGFIWRSSDDEHQALIDELFGINNVVFNMTVWESIDDLKEFTYKKLHSEAMKRKGKWFKKLPETTLVLWWVKNDCMPAVDEAKLKLNLIGEFGPTSEAFSFSKPFNPPNV